MACLSRAVPACTGRPGTAPAAPAAAVSGARASAIAATSPATLRCRRQAEPGPLVGQAPGRAPPTLSSSRPGSGARRAPAARHALARRVQCAASSAGDSGRGAGDGDAPEPAPASGGPSRVPDTMPAADATTDWREFRARLVASSSSQAAAAAATAGAPADASRGRAAGAAASSSTGRSWAHPLAVPEKGCLLIAHPSLFRSSQTYFHQAVVFLFDHGPDGSAGLILNRPTVYTIGKVGGADALLPEFASNVLHLGGDVGKGTVHLLHGEASVEGSVPIWAGPGGVRMGGMDAAKRLVRDGALPASRFRWFSRYAGWSPGQLAREVESNVWFVASASADLVLDLGRAEAEAEAAGGGSAAAGGGGGGVANAGGVGTSAGPSRNFTRSTSLWHEVLTHMGGEYAEVARKAAGEAPGPGRAGGPGGDAGGA